MKDLKNLINVVPGVPVQAFSSAKTVEGSLVDLNEFNSACLLVLAGNAWTDGSYTLTVKEGDAADGSDLADVDPSLLVKDAAAGVVGAANAVSRVGYVGTKRFIKPSLTSTGVTTGATAGVLVIEGNPKNGPVA